MYFHSIDALEDWLAPLDWSGFWDAVTPLGLALPARADCTAQIDAGEVTRETVLSCLKHLTRHELTRILGLERALRPPHYLIH